MVLEVVLKDSEDPKTGEAEAKALMKALEISEKDLIDKAYVDLC